MADIAVDHDPFAEGSAVAVEHDPFAAAAVGAGDPTARPTWNYSSAVQNALLLGHAPQVRALGETAAEGLFPLPPSGQFNQEAPGAVSVAPQMDFWSRYGRNLSRIDSQRAAYNIANPLSGPLTEIAGSIGPSAGLAALTPGMASLESFGLAGRTAAGMVAGTEAGAIQAPLSDQSMGQSMVTGGLVGGALPAVGSALGAAFVPRIAPEVAAAATGAAQLGVRLRPSQLALANVWQRADRLFASGGNETQLRDLTRAVSRTIGANTETLNLESFNTARDAIRTGLDQIALQTPRMPYNRQFDSALRAVTGNLTGVPPDGQRQVRDVVSHLIDTFRDNGGWIDGRTFQRLTAYRSAIGNLASPGNAPAVREIGGELHDALLDMLQQYAPAGTRDQLGELRSQWNNTRIVEPAVQAAGPAGVINPRQLFTATRRIRDNSDLRTLGQVGPFMPTPTATGAAADSHSTIPPWMKAAGLTAEVYAALEHPEAALAGAGFAGAGYAAAKGAGAILSSEALRRAALARALGTPGASGVAGRLVTPGVVGLVNGLGGTGQ